jgi:hypothetical protein
MAPALAAAATRALAALPPGEPLLAPGAATVLVLDARDPAAAGRIVPAVLEFLGGRGIGRGRVIALLPALERTPAGAAGALRAAGVDLPIVRHDPRRSACFTAGRADGVAIELNDELREAEAIVLAARVEAGASWRGVVCPGLASQATVAALATRGTGTAGAPSAADLLPVDLAVLWSTECGVIRAAAGAPRDAERALHAGATDAGGS